MFSNYLRTNKIPNSTFSLGGSRFGGSCLEEREKEFRRELFKNEQFTK